MGYLLINLWPWVAVSLGIGLITGWFACSRTDDSGH